MEMLQLLEGLQAQDASVSRLFGDAGQRVRNAAHESAQYLRKLAEAARFIAEVKTGRRPMYHLQEAMGTSDFPNLFGDIIDRQLLANYQEAPQSYRNYCKINTVSDFRTVKRFPVNGSEAVLEPVAQQAPYPESKLVDGVYSYAVGKYGRKTPFAWEAIINDDLGGLTDIPARYGRAARRSEEKFATQLFVSSTGPNATFFSDANKNKVNATNGASSTNPILSISALQDAYTVISKQVDSDGEPIAVEMYDLVVPPALEVIAQNILNSKELWLNENGGTTNTRLIAENWMKGRLRLSVNWYLPIVDTTHGMTAWYLFASPQAGRPALEVGFLRGHETPEIFMKQPNAVRVGGGPVNPGDGDFDTDSILYKIRHVFGGTLMEPKSAVASNGSGS